MEIWEKGGGLSLPEIAFFSAKKGQYYSNRSRNLCIMIKTVHAGIDGLKVDTQVLKLLRILFVEHYKHTLLIFVFKILLGKVRLTYVGYAVRSEIARSTGCGQICINEYAVSQKFRAARTSNEEHNAVVLWCGGVSTEDVAIILARITFHIVCVCVCACV